MENVLKELPISFIGTGEVKGYNFEQVYNNNGWYIYKVSGSDINDVHFEVFKKRINTRFNCISYPQSNSFGINAWNYNTIEKCYIKVNQ